MGQLSFSTTTRRIHTAFLENPRKSLRSAFFRAAENSRKWWRKVHVEPAQFVAQRAWWSFCAGLAFHPPDHENLCTGIRGAQRGVLPMTEASDWRSWYGKARWRKRARHQLLTNPFCAYCLKRGEVVLAVAADHVEPHRGSVNAFHLGELQSLCARCHNSAKRSEEVRGYAPDIGVDGYPLDRRHPCYPNAKQKGRFGAQPAIGRKEKDFPPPRYRLG
jgi:5-methylcytosine-specific restriction endonuclease McrA